MSFLISMIRPGLSRITISYPAGACIYSPITITLDTTEGLNISATVKITGVVGLTCVN